MPTRNKSAPASVCGTKCFSCKTREKSEWSELSDAEIVSLNVKKVCTYYPAGHLIFSQGTVCHGIYCISSGLVGLRKTDPSGTGILVRLVTAGETLGYRTFFAGGPYSASAETLTDAKVCFIERNAVEAIIERNPMSAYAFLRRVAQDLLASEEAQLQTVSMSTRERLVNLLLGLRDEFGSVEDGEVIVALPLSRQDTAAMLGTRPETLARLIRSLEEDGVAKFNGRSVRIPDIDALFDEVEDHVNEF